MRGIHICTPVWGQIFVENYINYVLKSLLAKNNIPYVSSKTKLKYTIYTKPENELSFNKSDTIKSICKFGIL